MRITLSWILFMILPCILVEIKLVQSQVHQNPVYKNSQFEINSADKSKQNEQIISVRITSSVAVDRGAGRVKQEMIPNHIMNTGETKPAHDLGTTVADLTESFPTATNYEYLTTTIQTLPPITDLPPHLAGANIEYIKQLQAKKDPKSLNNSDRFHKTHVTQEHNDTFDSIAEPSNQNASIVEEFDPDIPLARSIPLSYSSKAFLQRPSDNGNQKLTTVSFNVVHDSSKAQSYDRSDFMNNGQPAAGLLKYYNEPSRIYSEPAKVYSEPAKFYSEPAKVYSEPAKVYSEPAKVYSEPAKVYSEPAKFYSEPASLHLRPEESPTNRNPWIKNTDTTAYSTYSTTPTSLATGPMYTNEPNLDEHQPEKNYEVDEKVSVMTDGRSHGVQPNNPENCKQENCKVGYVVEGRQYRKYRVEERTSDGFIVGEYGVVRNEDGALRGVRYTADSEASPRLIHDALMKFLQLK